MTTWFKVIAPFKEMSEKGVEKIIKKQFLFDGVNFTDVEARAIKELELYSDFAKDYALDIKKFKLYEMFVSPDENRGEYIYEVKIEIITFDEKKKKERRQKVRLVIDSNELSNVHTDVATMMKGSMSDYSIVSVVETKIEDVFKGELKDKANSLFKENESKEKEVEAGEEEAED